ncbi:MAG: radical SAM protein [Candidatus Zhuqueibacterota bacterium]
MPVIPRRNLSRTLKKALSQPGYALRALQSRARSYLTYQFRNGYSAHPETISLFLTYRCNLRCSMCGQWGENGIYRRSRPEDELPTQKLLDLLDEVRSFRPNITLFGGEPFLHRDWSAIVQRAKHHRLRVNAITNGTLLHRFAAQIVDSQLDELIISLDGPEPIHDAIRNKPGAFSSILRGIAQINELKARCGSDRPVINITSVLTPQNVGHLKSLAEIAGNTGAKSITFHHLIFINAGQYENFRAELLSQFRTEPTDWRGFVRDGLPDVDVDALLSQISDLTRLKNGVDISFYPNLPAEEIRAYYSQWDFRSGAYPYRCLSPWMVAYIFPDGSVRPFHSMNFNAGNIMQQSFKQIWNGPGYRSFRSHVKQRRCFSVCSRCTEFYRY